MPDDLLTTVKAWLAKVVPCPKCGGDGVVAVYSSHAEHDPGCDGSCRNCPVEVQDCEQGPCDCVFAQAAITEADYQQVCIWLRSLLSRCREAEKSLAAERERHAEDVEHAFAAGVTFTATCTDQMSAGLRKWPEYKAKWARREP